MNASAEISPPHSPDKERAVELRGLTVTRGREVALKQIDCIIPARSLTVVFGPNGAGKTTLLQVLTGEIEPDSGSVAVFGRKPKECPGIIGYVPQFFSVRRDFPLTVFSAVAMGLYPKTGAFGVLSADRKASIVDELERLGVAHLSNAQVWSLSGGQLQRVMIARALVSGPRILLLDEATSGIDAGAKESLFDLLLHLKREMTVIFVTHDVSVISQEVDCILCLNKELVSHGSPSTALSDEAVRCMYGEGIALFSHCHAPHVHVPEHES